MFHPRPARVHVSYSCNGRVSNTEVGSLINSGPGLVIMTTCHLQTIIKTQNIKCALQYRKGWTEQGEGTPQGKVMVIECLFRYLLKPSRDI